MVLGRSQAPRSRAAAGRCRSWRISGCFEVLQASTRKGSGGRDRRWAGSRGRARFRWPLRPWQAHRPRGRGCPRCDGVARSCRGEACGIRRVSVGYRVRCVGCMNIRGSALAPRSGSRSKRSRIGPKKPGHAIGRASRSQPVRGLSRASRGLNVPLDGIWRLIAWSHNAIFDGSELQSRSPSKWWSR